MLSMILVKQADVSLEESRNDLLLLQEIALPNAVLSLCALSVCSLSRFIHCAFFTFDPLLSFFDGA